MDHFFTDQKSGGSVDAFKHELLSRMPSLEALPPSKVMAQARSLGAMKSASEPHLQPLDPVAMVYLRPAANIHVAVKSRYTSSEARQKISRYGRRVLDSKEVLPRLRETPEAEIATIERAKPDVPKEWLNMYDKSKKVFDNRRELRRISRGKTSLPSIHRKSSVKQRKACAVTSIGTFPADRHKWTGPRKWSQCSKSRSQLCSRCSTFVGWKADSDISCSYCSAVAHLKCLSLEERLVDEDGEWTCPDCREEVDFSRNEYLEKLHQAEEEERRFRCQQKIAARWRATIARKTYCLITASVVHLQSMIRTAARRQEFRAHRIRLMRPMSIRVTRAQGLVASDWDTGCSDPYVVVTIIDDKMKQLWRCETAVRKANLNPEFDEQFLIPGVHGNCTIVVTVLDQDDLRPQFLGQACWSPAEKWNMGSFLRGRPIDLELELGFKKYSPIGSNLQPLNVDYSQKVIKGTVSFTLQCMTTMDCMSGPLLGPSLSSAAMRSAAAGEAVINKKPQKKIFASICDHTLYIHKAIGEMPARVEVPLDRAKLKIIDGSKAAPLEFMTEYNELKLHFVVSQNADRNRWRSALELGVANSPHDQLTMDKLFSLRSWEKDSIRLWRGANSKNSRAKGGRSRKKPKEIVGANSNAD